MSRIDAVRGLIEKYKRHVSFYQQKAIEAETKQKEMEEYLYQLQAPGFLRGRHRYTKKGRQEPYVISGEV